LAAEEPALDDLGANESLPVDADLAAIASLHVKVTLVSDAQRDFISKC
jgi:hypothetical protein